VRNPLAGVRGSLEVLRSRMSTMPKEREVVQAMMDRLDVLDAKVDDILRFAKPRDPVLQAVDITPVIRDAITSAAAAAATTRPSITFTPQPIVVRADAEMLRAALLNVLMNACQAGGDTVEVCASAAGDVCLVTVADRGSGIPPDVIERIFDAFYTTKKSGTGLGLPIVKRLMDLQQGTVAIRPREGGGTLAELTIQMARQSTGREKILTTG
jgi:signal transduction histidine kinase